MRLPARTLRRLVPALLAVAAALTPHAAAQFPSDVPPPLRSRDLEALAKEIAATPAQRESLGRAMDAYVARWQAVRDGALVRASREREEALQAQNAALVEAHERGPDSAPPAPRGAAQLSETTLRLKSARSEAIALQATLCDAVRDALANDPTATPAQREAAEAWGAHQQRRTLLRSLGGMGGMILTSGALADVPRPPSEALADPAVRDAVERRIRQFERESLALLRKDFARGSSYGPEDMVSEPVGDTPADFRIRGLAAHGLAELKAVAEIAALLPPEQRAPWLRAARRTIQRQQLWSWPPPLDPADAVADLPAAGKPGVEARISKWQAERDAAEAALPEATTQNGLQARQAAIRDLDAAAVADLATLLGDPAFEIDALRTRQMERFMKDRMTAATADPEDDPSGMVSTMASLTERSTAAAGTADEAAADDGPRGTVARLAALGTLRRADLELIRARLGLADADRALWDTLASDLMTKLAAARDAADGDVKALIGDAPDLAAVDRAMGARRRFADEAAAAESAWFDAVGGAFPAVPKDRLERERSRRALRRVLEAGSVALAMARFSGNRWIDTDLDVAVDALAADARGAAEPALAAWRLRKADDLRRLCEAAERGMREMTGPNSADVGEEAVRKRMDGMTRMKRDLDECSRRAEAEQVAAVESVAGAVPPPQAALFRRGIQRQLHPEAYRDQDRLDAAIDKALSDESLTGEQKVALAVAWEESRTRFDPIAAALVAAARDAEAAMGAMMGGGATDRAGQAEIRARAQAQRDATARRAALQYDATELRAHTVRAVRQAIGDAKADAAGVK